MDYPHNTYMQINIIKKKMIKKQFLNGPAIPFLIISKGNKIIHQRHLAPKFTAALLTTVRHWISLVSANEQPSKEKVVCRQ